MFHFDRGSTIAKIVGKNVQENDKFDKTIKMYVYEELVNGRKLTEIINTEHENVKYLPGHKLPENVVAVPDVVEAAQDADIIIFVLPHQFMTNTCKPLIGKIKKDAFGVSLCKVGRTVLLICGSFCVRHRMFFNAKNIKFIMIYAS